MGVLFCFQAGAAAAVLSQHPTYTPAQVFEEITKWWDVMQMFFHCEFPQQATIEGRSLSQTVEGLPIDPTMKAAVGSTSDWSDGR